MNNNHDAGHPNRNFGDDLTNLPQTAVDQSDKESSDEMSIEQNEPEMRAESENIPYFDDIFAFLRSREEMYRPGCDYLLDFQHDVTEKMRATIIDWLVDIHSNFKLRDDTLYFTVNLFDRFLAKRTVHRNHLQLFGVACMLVASKLEEIHPPLVNDFSYMTRYEFSRAHILEAEQAVLLSMDWNLCITSSWTYLKRYCAIQGCTEEETCLARYFAEENFLNYRVCQFSQNMIACCALYLALWVSRRQRLWSPELEAETNLTEQDLRVCTKSMCTHIKKQKLQSELKAVYRKFSTGTFYNVAQR